MAVATTYHIEGGRRLFGEVAVSGSKNAALPVIVASALACEGESIIENVPHYTDILDLLGILTALGIEAGFIGRTTIRVAARDVGSHIAPYGLASRIRGSVYLPAMLLARLGRAEVALPGGDVIGARPIDFHLRGFASLGAEVAVEHGVITAETKGLIGTQIFVERQSVGTTCNLMIAAALAKGTTVLDNAAREPEVVDLANFISAMGGRVRGAGTHRIRIDGVPRLHGTTHEIIPDRLEAGTFLLAASATRGRVTVHSVIPEHLGALLAKMEMAGATIDTTPDTVTVYAPNRLTAIDTQTEPFPGFPTDIQPMLVSALVGADGISTVVETIFENRFSYTHELTRLGAKIRIVSQTTAIIQGVEALSGAPVMAHDIRAGAALVIAGLMAKGHTELRGVHHISRGYECLDEKMRLLEARIQVAGD